jgi:hypothetical protein
MRTRPHGGLLAQPVLAAEQTCSSMGWLRWLKQSPFSSAADWLRTGGSGTPRQQRRPGTWWASVVAVGGTIVPPARRLGWQGTALWFHPLGPSATTPTVHSRPSLRVTNFADPMTLAWPNWAKIFFNRGVAAKETDNCANYPRVTNPCGTGECGSSHVSRQPCAPGSPRRSDSDVRRPPRPNSVPVVPERHGRKCAATPAGSYPRRRSSG